MAIRYKVRKTFRAQVDLQDIEGQKGFITCEFNYFNQQQLQDLGRETMSNDELLQRILVSVEGFLDDDGKQIPASEQYMIVRNDVAYTNKVTQKFLDKITGAAKGN